MSGKSVGDIGAIMQGRQFSSLEEANAELARLIAAKNAAPLDELFGLSPEQLDRFLYHSFDSPGLVDYNLALNSFPDAPLFRLSTFPQMISVVPDVFNDTREDTLKHCFSLRSLSRFAHFFGFVELSDPQNVRWIEKLDLKKTRFLDEWIRFTLS